MFVKSPLTHRSGPVFLEMTAKIREVLATKPKEFDPRKYLGPARDELVIMYRNKNENVLGSSGKA